MPSLDGRSYDVVGNLPSWSRGFCRESKAGRGSSVPDWRDTVSWKKPMDPD